MVYFYNKQEDTIFLNLFKSMSIIGFILLILSNFIKFKDSFKISYGILVLSLIGMFLMIIIFGIRKYYNDTGIIFVKNFSKYFVSNTFPAWAIMLQMFILMAISIQHSDYLYTANTPTIINGLNYGISVVLICQMILYWYTIQKLISGPLSTGSSTSSILNIVLYAFTSVLNFILIGFLSTELNFKLTDG